MLTVLENDHAFARSLPLYTVVTASAGSGKTRALKQRVVQLLLSRTIPANKLNNILAITFTNNAAREMKQRVLDALKSASMGNAATLAELQSFLLLDPAELQMRAEVLVGEILDDYSDFQIQTIDSFLARVFKASALELGASPDLAIVLDSEAILDEAFSLFAGELSEGTPAAGLFHDLVTLLMESQTSQDRFLWNPYADLSVKVKDLYKRIVLTSKHLKRENFSHEIQSTAAELLAGVAKLDATLTGPGLVKSKKFEDYVLAAKRGDVDRLLDVQFPSSPLKKTESDKKEFSRAAAAVEPLCDQLTHLREQLIVLKARQHYQPYVDAHALLSQSIERVKRERSQVDLGDVIKKLADYLKPGVVPEVYYSLGESLVHYLIDEFQDTNPIQWETLEPLVGNALATKGSLFVVGDMKQSIYGFRGADWQIMQRLRTTDVFPSATKDAKALTTNFRSYEKILRFNEEVFKSILPGKVGAAAAEASGLSIDKQEVREGFQDRGYVELTRIPADALPDENQQPAEKKILLDALADCLARGYRCSDMAILSPRNKDIISISGWLNERRIPFISHSSLDVRNRAITGELLALLRFLDSPIDDLSFATVLLGRMFRDLLSRNAGQVSRQEILDLVFEHRHMQGAMRPLYTLFRTRYPQLWQDYFEDLFNVVGYLPVYDLLAELYKVFGVFALLPEEEATLAKILEVVRSFEEQGENSLKNFLRFADESSENADWNIDIPTDIDAVRVMTIHKAKGLEAKVVFVLLYDSVPRRDSLTLEEDGEEVRIVRVNSKIAGESEELDRLYQTRELRLTVDELNKLYVALTRAEEEMYVISVLSTRAKAPSAYFPESGYEPGPRPTVKRSAPPVENSIALFHTVPRSSIRPAEYAGIALHETRRGEFFHAVLESIVTFNSASDALLEQAIDRAQTRVAWSTDGAALQTILKKALLMPEIQPYFQGRAGRTILNEQEFAAPDGALTRMDRVVVDSDRVTVIDYKTGEDKKEYGEQVLHYMKILADLYRDRPVHGLLLFIDRLMIREVG